LLKLLLAHGTWFFGGLLPTDKPVVFAECLALAEIGRARLVHAHDCIKLFAQQ
jgi:hypothetical protein